MSATLQAKTRQKSRFPLLSVTTLAQWRLRRTWFLLCIITLGMVAAIVVTSAIPLFSDVMTTAGLRSTLTATPASNEVELNTISQGMSSRVLRSINTQFTKLFQQTMTTPLQPAQFALQSNDFSFSPIKARTSLTLYGTSLQQAAPHLDALQGRVARLTKTPTSDIEMMITNDTAQRLGLHIGSVLPLKFQYLLTQPSANSGNTSLPPTQTLSVNAHIVGIFAINPKNSSYWHGTNFKVASIALESNATTYFYTFLTDNSALLALFDFICAQHHIDAVFSTGFGYPLDSFYDLDSTHIQARQLDSLINQFARLQNTFISYYGYISSVGSTDDSIPITFPYLVHATLRSSLFSDPDTPSSLERLSSRIDVTRIPTLVLALQVIALILFFVSLMAGLLVDRQADTIAIIRSRGASSGQVFGALLTQYLILALCSLLIGLPLAVLIVLTLTQHILPATEQNAVNIITDQPLQAFQGLLWYGLAIAGVVLLTMSISLFFAARADILSMRRESARSVKRPLWQRLNLDMIAGVIAVVGYAISFYLTSISTVLQGDAKVLIATPLSIIAPFFLIIGLLLLFLRFFPLLLRFGAYITARGRGAVSLLALAQIARSPRQALRMTMLLAIATSFTLFTLVYTATEAQHIQDIATYQIGADFSGGLAYAATNQISPPLVMHKYQAIPGVLSTSVGYIGKGLGGTASFSMQFHAVDAASFGNTVLWSSTDAAQTGKKLLAKLQSSRVDALLNDAVPAIVDTTTLNKLNLHIGSTFVLKMDNTALSTIRCSVVGVMGYIPTFNNLTPGSSSGFLQTGSMLIDYQTFASVYKQDAQQKIKTLLGPPTPPSVNQIWLHTKQDTVSLASVRTALNQADYKLNNVVDRQALLTSLTTDPLYLILTSILSLGTVVVLALALVGDLLASWLSVRTRLTNFALLRALGTTPAQVNSMLVWEQAIVYISGLILGTLFGVILAITVVPALTVTNLNTDLSTGQFYALQSIITTPLVIPPTLPLALLALVAVFGIALLMMIRVVAQPSLGQTLRLNED